MDLNVYCPAVSQIMILTFEESIWKRWEPNSTPSVGW